MVDGSGGIVADPARLREIAGAVDATVGILGGAYGPRALHLIAPMGNWSTGQAATAATDVWGPFITRLHASVDGVAAGMRAAADGYTVTDATDARLLDKAR